MNFDDFLVKKFTKLQPNRKYFELGILFHYTLYKQLKNYSEKLISKLFSDLIFTVWLGNSSWGKELTRLYIKRYLFNHSVYDKLFSCAHEITVQKLWHVRIKNIIGNKKLYHIYMHCVSKEIGNQ